ncbi:Uncharacterized protein APZ42_030285 [Daphnia magna]|uniref:Uncharacterized protein n=1 Tax=Daphnia magna TaxID=35525 RepID=A0A0P6FKD9_9CRUS|nr:Uncharacterized protein APZ42_030285 [Daphnia magna]
MSSHVSKMKKMLALKKDHQQCKIDGLEYLKSFYTLCPLIISSNTCLCLARRHIFASPVARSSLRPSPRLRFARRPIFASPVVPSSLRPSLRLRFARRLVFASWSPPLQFALSSPRLCGIVVFCNV